MKKIAFFKIFSIFTLSFFLFSCKSQQPEQKKRVVIWTSCSEFVQYIELFNKTHRENNAVLVYKENPALSIPPARDETPPDIIIGSWLRNDKPFKNFKPLDYIFYNKILSSDIFYQQLFEAPEANILVVDDNEMNRELLKSMLEEYYTVHEVCNGQEAMDYLLEHPGKISLIVLYGEIPLDDMELFNQILEEKQAKYLFLLDSDGNYIVRYGITLKEKSLIETLDMVRFDKDNPQVHNSTQVLEKMKKKEEILYAINRGQNEEIGVLTPIPDSSSVGVALMPDHGIDWIMFPA